MDSFDAATAGAVADLQRRQSRRARWTAIGSLLLTLLVLARCVVDLWPGTQSCFAARLTATDLVNDAIRQRGGAAHVTDFAAPVTTASANAINHCTARVTLSDGSRVTAAYRVEPKQVVLEGFRQASGA